MDSHTGRNQQFPLADLAPAIGLQPAGTLRRLETMRGPAVGGPDVPLNWLGEGLGVGCGADHHAASARDGPASSGENLTGLG